MTESLNHQSMNDKGVCRAAPATPGLVITKHFETFIFRSNVSGEGIKIFFWFWYSLRLEFFKVRKRYNHLLL